MSSKINEYGSPLYQKSSIAEKDPVNEDSFSDIDESMARYNKRRGIQDTSKSRERSKSANNTDDQPSRNSNFKNTALLSKSRTSMEELRNSKKNEEERKQNKIYKLLKSKGYDSKQKDHATIPDSEEAAGEVRNFLNGSSQLTSIEKEETYDMNDQSTMMKRLRRQMSTNYRKKKVENGERDTDSHDVTQKNSSSGDRFQSTKYRKRRVDAEDFEIENSGKQRRTEQKEKEVQESKDSIDLKEISYYISSVDQTTHRKKEELVLNRLHSEVQEVSKESTISEDEESPDEILKQGQKNAYTEGDNIFSQKQSSNREGSQDYFSRKTSKTQIQDVEKTHQYENLKYLNVKRVQMVPEYDPCSQTNTLSSGGNNRPSTILEADTCQEETANNFSSIVHYGNKSLSPVTRLQIHKAQSNTRVQDQASHALNSRKNSAKKGLSEKYSKTIEHSKSKESLINQLTSDYYPQGFLQEMNNSGTKDAVEQYRPLETEKSLPWTVKGSQNNIFNRVDSMDFQKSSSRQGSNLMLQFNSNLSDTNKVPFVKSYKKLHKKSANLSKQQSACFPMNEQKLKVACFIKETLDYPMQASKSKSNERVGRSLNKLQTKGKSYGSGTNRSMSSSKSSLFNNFIQKQNYESIGAKSQRKGNSDNTFFSTDTKISEFVFKQLFQDNKISKEMIKTTLAGSQDLSTFISGNKKVSVDGEANLRLFQFDACLNENQHSKIQIKTGNQYLRQWFINNPDQDEETINFCFLFGSGATQKSEEMNFLSTNSLIQKFLKELEDPIRLLRVTMFFQDQEFVLNHKVFKSSKKSQREIGMQIREALRDKRRLIQKLVKQKPDLSIVIQHCSHFRIQINNYVFIDLADLSGLQMIKNQEIVQTLTNDFGSMTNEILRQSKFYVNHEFYVNSVQKQSAFNNFLQEKLSYKSNVLMYAYITNDENDLANSSITLDFAHKIRSFCSGQSDDCLTPQYILESQRVPEIQDAFNKLSQVYLKISRMESRISRETSKLKKNEKKTNQNVIVKLNQILQKLRKFSNSVMNSKSVQNSFTDPERVAAIQNFINEKLNKAQHTINDSQPPSKNNTICIEDQITDTLQDELRNQIINITKVNNSKTRQHENGTGNQNRNYQQQIESFTLGQQSSSRQELQGQVKQKNLKSVEVNRPQSVQLQSRIQQYPLSLSKGSSLIVQGQDKKSRSKAVENRTARSKKATNPSPQEIRSLSSGYGRFRGLSQNGRKQSNDVSKAGKNAVKKIIKKVNKDLPTNVEDELNNEIEKSLNLLKTQKGIEFTDPREQTDYSYLMSDTKMSKISLKEDIPALAYDDLQNSQKNFKARNRSRKASRSRSGPKMNKTESQRIVEQPRPELMIQNQQSTSENFQIEQELYDRNQMNRELIMQCEMLKNQLDNQRKEAQTIIKQQMQFQKDEFDTQLAMQELELKSKNDQIAHLKKENSKSVKTLEKMLNVQKYTKNLKSETIEQNKKYEEHIQKLDLEKQHLKQKYQEKIETLIQERDSQKEQNHIIINQVKIMKEAIKDSRDSEIMNKELLTKNKDKNERIQNMKSNEKLLMDQMKENQKYIAQLKERIVSLERKNNDRSEIDELNSKYQAVKSKLMEQKREEEDDFNQKQLNNDLIDRIKDLKAEVVNITLARDKFRSLTLDQKQEIRKLKSKYSASTLRDENSHLEENRSTLNAEDEELNELSINIKETAKCISQKENHHFNQNNTMTQDTRGNNSSSSLMMKHYDSVKTNLGPNKKDKAINDIKSLIQDYKKDKLLSQK